MSTTASLLFCQDNHGMKRGSPPDEQFASRFKELCADKGIPWKSEAIGRFIGKTGTMAWNYMHGVKLPGMESAIDLSRRFDCQVEWLLTGRGHKHVSETLAPGPIATVVQTMQSMEPVAQYKAQRMIEILADAPPDMEDTHSIEHHHIK